jgi:hypothetical protein
MRILLSLCTLSACELYVRMIAIAGHVSVGPLRLFFDLNVFSF